ncbi:uncharacterized protein L3040_004282 [Drepanopeziza brunnea f. sp. 'multigermtubi']|uniref:uncharacterized protein n=1 Tax=Drepanopeziza brunnea f. sp. 'multigermtubi' TaxID=698441 RepID=UPI0023A5408A|nr:hypothetical protein L3040_004282 [Drepanopeziza brunnea f. sp. 'multigermtubi']
MSVHGKTVLVDNHQQHAVENTNEKMPYEHDVVDLESGSTSKFPKPISSYFRRWTISDLIVVLGTINYCATITFIKRSIPESELPVTPATTYYEEVTIFSRGFALALSFIATFLTAIILVKICRFVRHILGFPVRESSLRLADPVDRSRSFELLIQFSISNDFSITFASKNPTGWQRLFDDGYGGGLRRGSS